MGIMKKKKKKKKKKIMRSPAQMSKEQYRKEEKENISSNPNQLNATMCSFVHLSAQLHGFNNSYRILIIYTQLFGLV